MAEKINRLDIIQRLADLPGWALCDDSDRIVKTFVFKDFNEAWGFMSRCALVAERMDHHPEWFNVWSRVEVTLNTHDAGGITALDIEMASIMNQLAARSL